MLLAELGAGGLLAALALSGFAAIVSAWAGLHSLPLLARVGRRAFVASALAVFGAAACLETAFLTHDWVIAYVAEHADSMTPWPLLAAGFYSGQEGSLLYWTLVLTGVGSLALLGQGSDRLAAYATAVLAALSTFFLAVLVFVSSPFALLSFVPADGAGLNPLLRDGGMLVHPPFLLAGFATFGIPFAFAIAALLAGRADAGWIASTRRLALLAWGLQGAGLTLGMWWAYHVLGWGGYWGWDPVENVALLPWLASTAYIHSAQVQERRSAFRAWNFGLVILSFLLAVYGTFVVRSGVVESVHTFAVSSIGPWFLGFLGVAAAFSVAILAVRAPQLRGAVAIEAAVSREGAFLLQNLLFVGAVFAVLWGTLLPLTSRLWSGHEEVVGPAFYERSAGPIFLALLVLLAFGPLLPWRKAGRAWLRAARWPALAAMASAAALLGAGVGDWRALLALPAIAAALTTCVLEYARGANFARRLPGGWPAASARLLIRNRRRYAAYLAHFGIAVAAAGFVGSHLWQVEREAALAPGESITSGRYTLTLESAAASENTSSAVLSVAGGGTLTPSRTVYPGFGGQSSTHVAIRSTPLDDLYVVLAATDGNRAMVLVFDNPLVGWIWAGAALLLLGTLAAAWPAPPRAEPVRARVAAPALSGGAE